MKRFLLLTLLLIPLFCLPKAANAGAFLGYQSFGFTTNVWLEHDNPEVADGAFTSLSIPVARWEIGTDTFRVSVDIMATWGLSVLYIEGEVGLGVVWMPTGKYFGLIGGGSIGGLSLNSFSFRAYAGAFFDIPLAFEEFSRVMFDKKERKLPAIGIRIHGGYAARTAVAALDYIRNPAYLMSGHGFFAGASFFFYLR